MYLGHAYSGSGGYLEKQLAGNLDPILPETLAPAKNAAHPQLVRLTRKPAPQPRHPLECSLPSTP